jgi:hypothetical protein
VLVQGVLVASAGALIRRHTPAGTTLAASALLRRSDFGRGWRVSAPPPRSVPRPTCPRFHPATKGVVEVGAAASPTFSGGSSGPFVSQSAFAFATSAQRAAFWHAVSRPGLLRCVEDSLRHGSAGGVHFTVAGGRALPLPALGVQAHGYRVRGTANTTNQSVDVYVDLILLGRGRTVSGLSVSSFEQPVARRLELRLARVVAARLS